MVGRPDYNSYLYVRYRKGNHIVLVILEALDMLPDSSRVGTGVLELVVASTS